MLLLHEATGASQAAGRVVRLLQQIWPFCGGQDEEKLQGRHVYCLRSTKKKKLIESACFLKIYCHCTTVMAAVAIATAPIKARRTVCCVANGSNVTQ